jgi:hypothetical protein
MLTLLHVAILGLYFNFPSSVRFFKLLKEMISILKLLKFVLEKDGEDRLDGSVKNEEVLHRVKEERNILHTAKRMKSN